MIIVITGGSGSGKSALAEELLEKTGAEHRIYLATMMVFGEEDRKKVERHKRLRAGKGFLTLEQPRRLSSAEFDFPREKTAVLVECVTNLAANELFGGGAACPAEEDGKLEERILREIRELSLRAKDLILVTGEVFSDGFSYPEETARYQRLLGGINRGLFAMAGLAVEAVCGIPLILKKGGEGL